MCDRSKLPQAEYYTVNDRPVKIVPTANGGKTVLVMNWHTGEFERDLSYLSRCYNPEQDVDRLSEEMFEKYVKKLGDKIEKKN